MEERKKPEWISISDAGRHFGVGRAAISKLVKRKQLETKKDTLDDRLVLVKFSDMEEIFKKSARYQEKMRESGSE